MPTSTTFLANLIAIATFVYHVIILEEKTKIITENWNQLSLFKLKAASMFVVEILQMPNFVYYNNISKRTTYTTVKIV